MSNGIERRSQIDTETVKALLLINGGGAVALLSLLPAMLGKDGYQEFVIAILTGVLIFMIGLICAVVHNQLRRQCSLHYDRHNMRPPKGQMLGFKLWEPTICCVSLFFMWLSILSFFVAGSYVAITGITTIKSKQSTKAAVVQMVVASQKTHLEAWGRPILRDERFAPSSG